VRELPEVLEQLHSDALGTLFSWGVSLVSGAHAWSWLFYTGVVTAPEMCLWDVPLSG